MDGDWSHVYVIRNKNPRMITEVPSMIIFKAPGSKIYALFPQEVDRALFEATLSFLSEAKIATRAIKVLKALLLRHKLAAEFLDLTDAFLKAKAGRKTESIADWLWGHRFCPIAKEEWMTTPLDKTQETHVAYYMELIDQAVAKIGVENISLSSR